MSANGAGPEFGTSARMLAADPKVMLVAAGGWSAEPDGQPSTQTP